jgi:hypothetical protein
MKRVPVPPMLAALVQSGMAAVEGRVFSDPLPCPSCGITGAGYDQRIRRFATLIDEQGTRDITVAVKRFRCRSCGRIRDARAPFYPDTRLGSPVVDLCVTFGRELPYRQVSVVLRDLGLVVDPGSVRNYASRDFGPVPVTVLFGLQLPQSVISLSLRAMRAGEGEQD